MKCEEREALGDREPFSATVLQLRRIVDSGVVGVAFWDRSGRIHHANDRFLEIVGYGREELRAGAIGWTTLAAGHWDSRRDGLVDVLASRGIARAVNCECARKDGTSVFLRLHSMTVPDSTRMLSIVVDVSEQHRAARERDALVERERDARSQAEAAVRARDDILAIVSHDLRNPLNTIAMSANLLASGIPEEGKAAQLLVIQRTIAGMNGLIDDLLHISRIASGCLVPEMEIVDAASICDDARSMLGPLAAEKAQRFECHAPSACLLVLADRAGILRVMSNLVGNAVKFTPQGGRITIGVEAREEEVCFSIADTGPGIDPADLAHIFDRFWQAPRVRRGGVGLGLAISKGIVEAHGGTIRAESRAGGGATFFFTLPYAH